MSSNIHHNSDYTTHLPGQETSNFGPREDDEIPTSVIFIVVLFIVILVVSITCGLLRLCKKEDASAYAEGPQYSVAISNRLFKEIVVKHYYQTTPPSSLLLLFQILLQYAQNTTFYIILKEFFWEFVVLCISIIKIVLIFL